MFEKKISFLKLKLVFWGWGWTIGPPPLPGARPAPTLALLIWVSSISYYANNQDFTPADNSLFNAKVLYEIFKTNNLFLNRKCQKMFLKSHFQLF